MKRDFILCFVLAVFEASTAYLLVPSNGLPTLNEESYDPNASQLVIMSCQGTRSSIPNTLNTPASLVIEKIPYAVHRRVEALLLPSSPLSESFLLKRAADVLPYAAASVDLGVVNAFRENGADVIKTPFLVPKTPRLINERTCAVGAPL